RALTFRPPPAPPGHGPQPPAASAPRPGAPRSSGGPVAGAPPPPPAPPAPPRRARAGGGAWRAGGRGRRRPPRPPPRAAAPALAPDTEVKRRWRTFAGNAMSGAQAVLVTRDNGEHRTDIEWHYRAAIRNARSELIIANAYFFPGFRLLRELRNAARRGVSVRL